MDATDGRQANFSYPSCAVRPGGALCVLRLVNTANSKQPYPVRSIDGGDFTNDSEYVRDLIRRDQAHQSEVDAIRGALIKGEESGQPQAFNGNLFKHTYPREEDMKHISWLTAAVVLSLATGGVAEEIQDQPRHSRSADGLVEASGLPAAGGVMMGEAFLDRFQTTITLRRNADGSVTQHCESPAAQESGDEN